MYVGTSVPFFAATNPMMAPTFLALGQLLVSQLKTTLIFLSLAMASSWLGVRLVRTIRASPRFSRHMQYVGYGERSRNDVVNGGDVRQSLKPGAKLQQPLAGCGLE